MTTSKPHLEGKHSMHTFAGPVEYAKFAIVTRTKDRPLLLRRAIEGILAQSEDDWVHVIVNDGGSPEPVDALASEFATRYGERLRVLHNQSSLGMEAASNLGVRATTSKLILIHDDDDSIQPDFLKKTAEYLDPLPYPSIRGVATLATLVSERILDGRISVDHTRLFRSLGPTLLAEEVAASNPAPPISFVFFRSAYDALGGFDESLPVLGDWEFLLRFICEFDVGVIQQSLANYHLRSSVDGSNANSIIEGLERHRFYSGLIRNRFMRDGHPAMRILVQLGADSASARSHLMRLYSHPVLGRLIRFWSKFINQRIPDSP